MSSNSPYSMLLLCMDIKYHCQALVSQFQGLIGASFHYKVYKVFCKVSQPSNSFWGGLMGVVMVPIIDIKYLVVVGGDLCSSFP